MGCFVTLESFTLVSQAEQVSLYDNVVDKYGRCRCSERIPGKVGVPLRTL